MPFDEIKEFQKAIKEENFDFLWFVTLLQVSDLRDSENLMAAVRDNSFHAITELIQNEFESGYAWTITSHDGVKLELIGEVVIHRYEVSAVRALLLAVFELLLYMKVRS